MLFWFFFSFQISNSNQSFRTGLGESYSLCCGGERDDGGGQLAPFRNRTVKFTEAAKFKTIRRCLIGNKVRTLASGGVFRIRTNAENVLRKKCLPNELKWERIIKNSCVEEVSPLIRKASLVQTNWLESPTYTPTWVKYVFSHYNCIKSHIGNGRLTFYFTDANTLKVTFFCHTACASKSTS